MYISYNGRNTMASQTIQSAKVDLTTCSICFETLKTPKHFPCLHSFCEGCIQTYIKTTFGLQKGGVNCPVCRTFVSKPDDVSVEEWSTKLPTNHILVSLIDMNESKSGQKLCEACVRENETESACSWCVNCSEALCKTCARCHRRNKATSNHKIVEIGEGSVQDIPLHHADVLCTEHPEKKVEAYCSDHSAVCCVTCVMLKHRKCENVSSIEDAAERKKQSEEVEEFENKLQDCKKSLEALVQGRIQNIQNFDTDISTMKKEINNLFIELSDHLNQLKMNILSEISKVEKEVRPEIEDERDEMKCRIPALENDLDIFQTNMKHAPPAHFLQAMEKLYEQKSIFENYVKDKSRKLREIRVTFHANEKLLEMRKAIQEFGKVTISRKEKDDIGGSVVTNLDSLTVVPTLTSDVDTYFTVTGVAILQNGQVVMSIDNNTLQLRDPHFSSVLSSISLPVCPWGIKMISDTEGAVAVRQIFRKRQKYQTCGLIIFNIQNNQIVQITAIKTDVNCDFAYHQGKYYVGCDSHIAVYDSNHHHVRNISAYNVAYMAARDDTSLCYTVFGGHTLYCITMDGNPVFTYSHDKLRGAMGVTVDNASSIYVCGQSSCNVHQLTHDGNLHRIILENLPSGPYCISFSTRGDKAVIGCSRQVLLYDIK